MAGGVRTITLRWSDWPASSLGHPPDRPVAVIVANRLIAVSPGASAHGVAVGERRRTALRACPDLLIAERDPAVELAAFESVLEVLAAYTPGVELVDPGHIRLPARGPSRLFGGEQALLERLSGDLRSIRPAGWPAPGIGVADGRALSALAALRSVLAGRPEVVPPEASTDRVADLPVSWLAEIGEVPIDLVSLLDRLGIRRLGDLAELAVPDVVSRFGPVGLHAHRLANGVDERPVNTVVHETTLAVEMAVDEPIHEASAVVFAARERAERLIGQVASSGRVCVAVRIIIETEHSERSEHCWYREEGLSAAAVIDRVRWQVEAWTRRPGAITSGVVLVRLTAEQVRADDGSQEGLWGGRSERDDAALRAVTRLMSLAGDGAVEVPVWEGGRSPVERYRWVGADTVDLLDTARVHRGDASWPGSIPAPAPSIVHEHPLDVELLDEVGEPVMVTGRGEVSATPLTLVDGSRSRAVSAWAGPWPLHERWWSPTGRRSARLQVVLDDGTAHLVAVQRRQWSIEATYG